ncbi:MAG: lipase family alpha/beta hydrolase [Pseudobdellovibrio sp.]
MKLLLLILSILVSTRSFANQEVVVLVPGFFNSFAAEYFSDDIVNTFQKRGLKVYVATGLNPIGTIEDNGERLEKMLANVEALEKHKVDFNIVAHSAGGLYTLYVANKGNFNIKNLLSVSTPYKGVEFIQKWIDDCTIFDELTKWAHLDGLRQLTPNGVAAFIDKIRVPANMKVIAFGGTQGVSLDIWNSRNLSLPFVVTDHYISEDSDGIVGFSSAMAVGRIKTTLGTMAVQKNFPNFQINLDHWEQVLDGNSFILFGIRNPDYIVNEQVRFYSGLADYLLNLLK